MNIADSKNFVVFGLHPSLEAERSGGQDWSFVITDVYVIAGHISSELRSALNRMESEEFLVQKKRKELKKSRQERTARFFYLLFLEYCIYTVQKSYWQVEIP